MNNYCGNCGSKIEPNTGKCSNCDSSIDIGKNVLVYRKTNYKPFFMFLIFMFVVIGIVIAGFSLILFNRDHTVRQYVKNSLSEYNGFEIESIKVNKCNGDVCKFSLDASCFSYEKISGCYDYGYKVKLGNGDILNLIVRYTNDLGVEAHALPTSLNSYNSFRTRIQTLLKYNEFNVNWNTNSPSVYLPVSFKDNLNEELIDGLMKLQKSIYGNDYSYVTVYFSDSYKISLESKIIYVYRGYSSKSFSSNEDVEEVVDRLTKWVDSYE